MIGFSIYKPTSVRAHGPIRLNATQKSPQKGAFLVPLVGACAKRKARGAEPRPHLHPHYPATVRAHGSIRLNATQKSPQKGAFWCRWSDSNRHGIATTGF